MSHVCSSLGGVEIKVGERHVFDMGTDTSELITKAELVESGVDEGS